MQVTGLTNATQVAAGVRFSLAVHTVLGPPGEIATRRWPGKESSGKTGARSAEYQACYLLMRQNEPCYEGGRAIRAAFPVA